MSKTASGEADSRNVSSRKELSEEWLREKYHGDGLTLNEIGDLVGLAGGTVGKRMDDCGIQRRNPGKPAADERLQDEGWFREMYYERDHSCGDIAEVCGCSRPTAQKWKRKHGIESLGKYKSRGEGEENPNGKEYVDTKCANCGEELHLPIRQIERAERNFCSHRCNAEWRSDHIHGEDHPLFIDGAGHDYGPDWPQIREKVLERDNERCQGCGVGRDEYHMDLDAHHITPFREFDDRERANQLDNLVTLCRGCHQKYEGLGVRPRLIDE